ncbi:dihydrodipicolinate synthase family protein [candidate division KSB1 bacterium]|nr:dihydrodipicolinate synthase family protein [candidate division KSB1 bacterium]
MNKKTKSPEKYGGTWPTMVTPFDENLKIDFGVNKEIVEWYLRFDIGGLYPHCLSSEMYFLSAEESVQLVTETVKTVGDRTNVVATANLGESQEQHIEFARRIADTGVDALMLLVPSFLQTDNEMEKYFLTMAEKLDLPLGIYECPVPRRFHLSVPLVKKLAETGRFVAYKETSCQFEKIMALHDVTKDTPMSLLQANAPYLLDVCRRGVPGSMNIASIWLADIVATVIRLAQAQDPMAESLHAKLCNLEMVQRSGHPVSSKYLLAKRGLPIGIHSRTGDSGFSAEVKTSIDYIMRDFITPEGDLIL